MKRSPQTIFVLSGTREHWLIARQHSVWGLPLRNLAWRDARAHLQQIEFRAGAEILAVSGSFAQFRAVVGSDRGIYKDDERPTFGLGTGDEIWPVRFDLTNIQEIDKQWYLEPEGDGWRSALEDVYFGRKSLYRFHPESTGDRRVDWEVVLGIGPPPSEPGHRASNEGAPEIRDPQALEDRTVDAFSEMGFRVDQLGYKQQYQRVPDGAAFLPRSLVDYLQRMNEKSYFVLWDCKFNCNPSGLLAEDERAIREYVTDFATRCKHETSVPEFWFLIIGRTPEVSARIQGSINRLAWPDELRDVGCKGVRAISFDWLISAADKALAHRKSGRDPDRFLGHDFPLMLRDVKAP